MRISVPRDRLPPPAQDEYYWADLEGLFVSTLDGIGLGQVDHLFSTPGNDVLVVKGERERLIPFIWGQVIKDVDLEQGLIRVDWDPGF
jgi:16S rRNA processing protein RimM